MKKILRITIIALYSSLLLSCATPAVPTELEIATTELSFGNGKGSKDISFTTNKNWTATSSDQWAKVQDSGTSGTISLTVEVDRNTSYSDRTATITIKAEDISKTVTVKQSSNIGVIVTQDIYNIDSKAQTIEVTVKHNVEFEVLIDESCKSWITLSDTKALSDSSVKFNIARNESAGDRTGEITFNQKDGLLFDVVTVTQTKPSSDFDETKIAYSIGMISDTHIDTGNGQNCQDKLTAALQQLGTQAAMHDSDGIDAVCVAGDFTQSGMSNESAIEPEINKFKQIYEAVYDPLKVPMIYTVGNHDPYGQWMTGTGVYTQAANIRGYFGSKYTSTDQEKTMRDSYECRHCILGNYHIVCITPYSVYPVTYPSQVKNWLDNTLNDITTADPERYVILLTHPMIYNTVYGSLLGPDWMFGTCSDYWYTKDLTSILSKYPQVMTFGGHLHFPINDPRSIWQGDFTAFGCGSTRYMAIEDGKYEDMKSATVMKDCADVSSGLLLQFDANGNARITKMFFSQNTTFGSPWEIAHPKSDKSHLATYNTATRKSLNTAPTLSTLDIQKSGTAYVATFAAGKDDEFVHHYILTLTKGGTVISTKRILSDYYRNAIPSQMKSTYTVSFGQLDPGSYELTLVAEDSWEAQSNPLTNAFTTDSKKTWALNAKLFDHNGALGKGDTDQYTVGLTVTEVSGENGNNVLIKGLFLDAEVEGKIEKSGNSITRIGIYLNSKKFYKADATRYCVLLPGCSKKGVYWGSYNFFPKSDKEFSDNNYDWLWFDVEGTTAKYKYYNAGQTSPNGKYTYLGLSFGWATQSAITSTEYQVIYQANYGTNNDKGMWLDLPSD